MEKNVDVEPESKSEPTMNHRVSRADSFMYICSYKLIEYV